MIVNLYDAYFGWMVSDVCANPDYDWFRYRDVLRKLHATPFAITYEMDKNRLVDACRLRQRFADDTGMLVPELPYATTLEVMVSLALRSYEQVMVGLEDYTPGVIFWTMMESLHLNKQEDSVYDECMVETVLNTLFDHKYAPDGDGGLFRIKGTTRDLRLADIWYQMQWWVASVRDWYGTITQFMG